jgi:hypothetical protein
LPGDAFLIEDVFGGQFQGLQRLSLALGLALGRRGLRLCLLLGLLPVSLPQLLQRLGQVVLGLLLRFAGLLQLALGELLGGLLLLFGSLL